MKDTKFLEQAAEHQLNKSITHLQICTDRLKEASLSIDDFPTARHELMDLHHQAQNILESIIKLKSKLDVIKTK